MAQSLKVNGLETNSWQSYYNNGLNMTTECLRKAAIYVMTERY